MHRLIRRMSWDALCSNDGHTEPDLADQPAAVPCAGRAGCALEASEHFDNIAESSRG